MKDIRNANVGSSLNEFLESEGLLSEVTVLAHKRVLALKIADVMQQLGITQGEMAKRMHTSRSTVHRLLDPQNSSITLDTIDKAVSALGMKLNISIIT